ncbi:MAG: hypothetical protein ACOYJS_02235 [Acutalibacteraceae bacterium]|jgi:hypothetical protein
MKTELIEVKNGFDGESCWVHARTAHISGDSFLMTAQKLDIRGSDLFTPIYTRISNDHGKSWSDFAPERALDAYTDQHGYQMVLSNFTPATHKKTGKIIGTGTIVPYDTTLDPKVIVFSDQTLPFDAGYSVYDEKNNAFGPVKILRAKLKDGREVRINAGCTQRYDLPDGDILLPVNYDREYITTVKLAFDGCELIVTDVGTLISFPEQPRPASEPSLIYCERSKIFVMTIRTDTQGYFAVSEDGLSFGTPSEWRWDDGSILENYNTQQHFVEHDGRLYLVYTRRGAGNDHVFRHRAPLFMAEIDSDRLVLLRDTEIALTPQRGARLGNFGVTKVSDNETWVVVAEWMQPRGCEKYGSDNTIFIVRLLW